ncbi:hypothetical protein BBO99_00001226 [Phytophthora kernoviae]|uniref:C2H2-type domain-containing protein n=1 Tax=Phytophthora kernoviae TaxID=325452 RepID=A0A3R7J7V7_9STRA|nr:hypothetical protein BBI17_004633 [Phytophthora kernoviae]RLN84567.1 hypothetical protein BBO99_00001226 [Phytophthora kernoviae]
MRLHGPLPLVRCSLKGCTRTFLSDIQLARHQKQHDVPRVHHCQITGCSKIFSTTGNLNRHVKKHHAGRKLEQIASPTTSILPVTPDHKFPRSSSTGASPTGIDQRYANSDIRLPMEMALAPTDVPCNDPWSTEMLDILGQILLY